MTDRISIIIVDDDEAILDALKDGLLLHGYHCETSTEGKTALEMINHGAFEVMVTDFDMPHMKGLELARKAKEIRPEMRIVLVTGCPERFSRADAIAAGVSEMLEKPFALEELIDRLKDSANS